MYLTEYKKAYDRYAFSHPGVVQYDNSTLINTTPKYYLESVQAPPRPESAARSA